MQLGIFARTFTRPTLEATLDAVVAHGFHCVQFNMACAGVESLPERIDAALCERIRREMASRRISMAAVSGTFNMIHPDVEKRREGLERLRQLVLAAPQLGTSVVTLCTGTRDRENMWRRHCDNDSPAAWADLKATLAAAIDSTSETSVTLAFEPEVANVIDSAARARRLLDEVGSPRLKVVLDGANLFHTGELPRMEAVLREAVELLARDVVIVHAKDLSRDGEAGHEAAGTGLMNYDLYLGLLCDAGFDGPLVMHGLAETQVAASTAFLRGKLRLFECDSEAG
jgi:sugar phosphate isomerase/epimerase